MIIRKLIGALACGLFAVLITAFTVAPKREYYQLKTYHLKDKNQRDRLETYLKEAYLPALHRAGVGKVGVFMPTDADSVLFVLIPFKSLDQFSGMTQTLTKDKQYVTAAQEYTNTAFDKPVFSRFESTLMQAFTTMPAVRLPKLQAGPSERIYELRDYEAATEKLGENKIQQFNNGELDIFERLGFNTVFCGQVIAGKKMPDMMYMTAFESKAERDAHWKAFGSDPGWKELNAKPEYAHNFMRADIYLLHPTAYSEI
jgi:hypothetical protein